MQEYATPPDYIAHIQGLLRRDPEGREAFNDCLASLASARRHNERVRNFQAKVAQLDDLARVQRPLAWTVGPVWPSEQFQDLDQLLLFPGIDFDATPMNAVVSQDGSYRTDILRALLHSSLDKTDSGTTSEH